MNILKSIQRYPKLSLLKLSTNISNIRFQLMIFTKTEADKTAGVDFLFPPELSNQLLKLFLM